MKKNILTILILISAIVNSPLAIANGDSYRTIKGVVIDSNNKSVLPFATVAISNSNISTTTNSEGNFIIKYSSNYKSEELIISFIGYEVKRILLEKISSEQRTFNLEPTSINLNEVPVFPTDLTQLMRMVLQRREINYQNDSESYRAFYREFISRNKKYISLTEAVINIDYPGYNSHRNEKASLAIGRKSTNYSKLDTLAFKLQGGPIAALMLDIMRRPNLLITEDEVSLYNYQIEAINRDNENLVFVITFEPKKESIETPFIGKFYIDMNSLAVTAADFEMNLSDKNEASKLFIKKKPLMARVYPTKAAYKVKYKKSNNMWAISHIRADVNFKINWKRKLFNSNYFTTIEMAITDKSTTYKPKSSDRLKINIIMEDAVDGFLDDDFWGEYNIIEPEEPIEKVIHRLKKSKK